MRPDGRRNDALREVAFDRGFTRNPHGSVLARFGETRVLCTAVIEEGVPPFLAGTGRGWLTAEYSMLPGSTRGRKRRDIARLRLDGRSAEIQRLIGRSLRAAIDLERVGERTIWIDCDVLQADGGTRTAAISGGFVALADAVARGLDEGIFPSDPIVAQIAAISVGVVEGEARVDLDAAEDQMAEVDMNLVMTADGDYVELQGSAEKGVFGETALVAMLSLGRNGVAEVAARQRLALDTA